nr:MAG TPA: hypothetical protein [Bacteriophage sp.]
MDRPCRLPEREERTYIYNIRAHAFLCRLFRG